MLDPKCKYPQAGSQYSIKTLVKEGASIGRHAVIGAGAFATKDVPDHALIVEIPRKIVGWLSEAGKKLDFDDDDLAYCKKSEKQYKLENELVKEVE